MASPTEVRQRAKKYNQDSPSGQVVDDSFSGTDISKPYGRLALRTHRKRFVREVLAALLDSATDIPRIRIQAQVFVALLVIVASLGVLFLSLGSSREERCINRFSDRDRPCQHRLSSGNDDCYQRVDVNGRVLYTRDRDGFHFEMNPTCSPLAPEDDAMKCVGEWSFAREDEMVWYLRRYLNVTSGTTSLVSLPSLKDRDVRLVAMRWIPRSDNPNRATWVFSSALIPRDEFPDVEMVMDGTVVVGQMVSTSNK